jgi:hypothetical protein
MENFTNETIDTTLLPKFEEVQFSVLDADYWKVTVLNVFFFNCRPWPRSIVVFNRAFFLVGISAAYFLSFLVLLLSRISFNKKFAFRTHDVLLSMGF